MNNCGFWTLSKKDPTRTSCYTNHLHEENKTPPSLLPSLFPSLSPPSLPVTCMKIVTTTNGQRRTIDDKTN